MFCLESVCALHLYKLHTFYKNNTPGVIHFNEKAFVHYKMWFKCQYDTLRKIVLH